MYYDFTVKIPDVKGKIIIKKKGNASYVPYEYGRDYKPDKKYAIPKRSIIGKLSDVDSSLMYPNEHCQDYFPEAILPEERPRHTVAAVLKLEVTSLLDAEYVIQKANEISQLQKMECQ